MTPALAGDIRYIVLNKIRNPSQSMPPCRRSMQGSGGTHAYPCVIGRPICDPDTQKRSGHSIIYLCIVHYANVIT